MGIMRNANRHVSKEKPREMRAVISAIQFLLFIEMMASFGTA